MKFYLNITTSKLLAYFIALASVIYGFVYEDGVTMLSGIAAATALITNKQYQDRVELKYNKNE